MNDVAQGSQFIIKSLKNYDNIHFQKFFNFSVFVVVFVNNKKNWIGPLIIERSNPVPCIEKNRIFTNILS